MSPSRLLAGAVIVLGLASVSVRALEYREPFVSRKDFAIDYAAAHALVHGRPAYGPTDQAVSREIGAPPHVADQYSGQPNWHTPFRILSVVPLTILSFPVAGVVWVLLSAACLVLAALLFTSAVGRSRVEGVVAGFGALALPIVQWDLGWGQINTPVLLLAVIGWRVLRRGKEIPAGIALGLAGALKLYPLLILIPLLRQRRWKVVSYAAICCGGLTLVSAGVTGWGFVDLALSTSDGFLSAGYNVSWAGFVSRTLSGLAGTIIATLGMLLLLVILWRADYWSAMPLILLAWPIVWDHYLILALPWLAISLATSEGRHRLVLMLGTALCIIGVPRLGIDWVGVLPTLGLILALLATSARTQAASSPGHPA